MACWTDSKFSLTPLTNQLNLCHPSSSSSPKSTLLSTIPTTCLTIPSSSFPSVPSGSTQCGPQRQLLLKLADNHTTPFPSGLIPTIYSPTRRQPMASKIFLKPQRADDSMYSPQVRETSYKLLSRLGVCGSETVAFTLPPQMPFPPPFLYMLIAGTKHCSYLRHWKDQRYFSYWLSSQKAREYCSILSPVRTFSKSRQQPCETRQQLRMGMGVSLHCPLLSVSIPDVLNYDHCEPILLTPFYPCIHRENRSALLSLALHRLTLHSHLSILLMCLYLLSLPLLPPHFSLPLLPPLAIVLIDVAVLAQSSRIQFLMGTIPRSFYPAVSVVAIGAHSLGIMRSLFVPTVIHLSSEDGKGRTSFSGETQPKRRGYYPQEEWRGVLDGGFPSLAFVC